MGREEGAAAGRGGAWLNWRRRSESSVTSPRQRASRNEAKGCVKPSSIDVTTPASITVARPHPAPNSTFPAPQQRRQPREGRAMRGRGGELSLIHISEPTRPRLI
eukprot:3796621-Rhodomonas_salina.1